MFFHPDPNAVFSRERSGIEEKVSREKQVNTDIPNQNPYFCNLPVTVYNFPDQYVHTKDLKSRERVDMVNSRDVSYSIG
jgi:hypothetical protein